MQSTSFIHTWTANRFVHLISSSYLWVIAFTNSFVYMAGGVHRHHMHRKRLQRLIQTSHEIQFRASWNAENIHWSHKRNSWKQFLMWDFAVTIDLTEKNVIPFWSLNYSFELLASDSLKNTLSIDLKSVILQCKICTVISELEIDSLKIDKASCVRLVFAHNVDWKEIFNAIPNTAQIKDGNTVGITI